jgi:hypothetical protein
MPMSMPRSRARGFDPLPCMPLLIFSDIPLLLAAA